LLSIGGHVFAIRRDFVLLDLRCLLILAQIVCVVMMVVMVARMMMVMSGLPGRCGVRVMVRARATRMMRACPASVTTASVTTAGTRQGG
jgi:hypothetical protein